MSFSPPSPGTRAGTLSPPKAAIQLPQSFHHEPWCFSAVESHSSALSRSFSLVQYQYLSAAGGLTMPAMWPEAPSTKRTEPLSSRAPRYVLFHGAMWSSTVEIKYVGMSTLDRSIGTPASVIPPASRNLFPMYMLRR